MNKIAVDTLQAGLIFTEPVYIDKDNLLVPKGVAVRQKDIDQLKAWKIDIVETAGEIQTEEIVAREKAVAAEKRDPRLTLSEVQENKGPYHNYVGLIERLYSVFLGISAGALVESRSIDYITSQLLQEVRDRRNSYISYILGGEVKGRELAKSSINTAILSALIAIELKLVNHKVLNITTGALLHDVGMLRLPKEILVKKGGLSEEERRKVSGHPLYAHRILTKELSYPDEVAFVALQHHERWDGEGYPQKTAGTAIDIGARIVSVADAFEAMVSNKPYRNSIVGNQAMKNLMADNGRRFDPNVLKTFIKIMGIYPIGSIVLLNNASLARVIEARGEAPLRPKIQLLIDGNGRIYTPDETANIDLLAEKNLYITKTVDPRDFAGKIT